ncbi:MAG: gliding motility-associated C-terminal domain-containing protein, partial [Bacteroidota bacterium]
QYGIFFLEFPPIVKDGVPFINSTPQLFPPLADYACINRPFYFDFAGSDPDGDSLVYSLNHPLNSSLFEPVPAPTPPPHPLVTFVFGLSGNNPIPADPGKGLAITNDGFLTVTPNQAGLFVFSVKVEEFRGGEKIGEVQRDFQMLVLDDCAPAIPPKIVANLPDGQPYIPGDTVVLNFDDPRCINFYITDQEAFSNVKIDIQPVNFETDENITALATPASGSLIVPGDSLSVEFCLPQCPYTDDGFFILDIVAFDDACAKPLTDSVRMFFLLGVFDNESPLVTIDAPQDTLIAQFDNTLTFNVTGSDPDGDTLDLFVIEPEWGFERVMMEFDPATGIGTVTSQFNWTLDCDTVRLGNQDIYPLSFVVEDRDFCEINSGDTVETVIRVIPIDNQAPVLTTEFIGTEVRQEDEIYVLEFGESFTIRARGRDADVDDITLSLSNAESEELTLYQFDWSGDVRARGEVSGDLSWTANCNFLLPGQTEIGPFTLEFVLQDEFCIFPENDTLQLEFLARDKPAPALEFEVTNAFTPNGDEYNQTFSIPDLPTDNCFGRYQGVTVFNRWGKPVFESQQRDFEWDGSGEPDGVYYWIIRYTGDISFKGWVALLR